MEGTEKSIFSGLRITCSTVIKVKVASGSMEGALMAKQVSRSLNMAGIWWLPDDDENRKMGKFTPLRGRGFFPTGRVRKDLAPLP